MKSISLTDLKLVSWLSHLTEEQLIHPDNDHLVMPALAELGFNINEPVEYFPCQHRNMQNKVVISYLLIGTMSLRREHITGKWSTLTDRMVAAAYQDPSLCRELCAHLNSSLNYNSFNGKDMPEDKVSNGEFPTTPEEEAITKEIQHLASLLLKVRGNPYKEDGGLKSFEDYKRER